jgi:hypothetical protein
LSKHPRRGSLEGRTPPGRETFAVLSISRTVRERLDAGRFDARVLAVFDRACNLVTPDGNVLALVIPQVGDGPLNVVVNGTPGCFAGVGHGAPLRMAGDRLQVDGLWVDLEGAAVWEPRPDWEILRARRTAIGFWLPHLRALCLRHAPAGSLLALLGGFSPEDTSAHATLSAAQKATVALREGWAGDPQRLHEGVTDLAGLGSGLTPAGDDFLAGAMLWAWLDHPTPEMLCRAVARVAAPRTTTLSVALLKATARGECSAAWHALISALSMGQRKGARNKIAAAVHEILSRGATSGADSLAGFLLHPTC